MLGFDAGEELGQAHSERDSIADVLVPGARVCFTGTMHSPTAGPLERAQMNELATAHGLEPVNTVTKSKCEVLIVAEAGTQSGKARKAIELGKPVFAASEFFAWIDGSD